MYIFRYGMRQPEDISDLSFFILNDELLLYGLEIIYKKNIVH